MEKKVVLLDGFSLTPESLFEIGEGNVTLGVSDPAWARLVASRSVIDQAVGENRVVYGITTGFGSFENVAISMENLHALQVNLIRSHSVGVGEPLLLHQVRMLIGLRLNSFCRGHSGVRPENVRKFLAMYNNNCLPYVPCQGTVGASGDLAPLAHLALGAIGEGKMWDMPSNSWKPAAEVLARSGVEPMQLHAKEGLAMINGTAFITTFATEAFVRAQRLLDQATLVAALSIEVLKGSDKYFDERIHAARPHDGQRIVATQMREYMRPHSAIHEQFKTLRVQDAYTIRCIPQVFGIVMESLNFIRGVLTMEMNSATDNPMVVPPNDVISGGNFHGEYPAKASDYLAIAAGELGIMSERRLERMVNMQLSSGLPPYLIKSANKGLESGFMIVQYTAAALVSENKALSHPASSDSIPTSSGQEDHVSMGGFAARKALSVVQNATKIVALELFGACQALDILRPLTTTPTLERVYSIVRERVAPLESDRFMGPDMEACIDILTTGKLLPLVHRVDPASLPPNRPFLPSEITARPPATTPILPPAPAPAGEAPTPAAPSAPEKGKGKGKGKGKQEKGEDCEEDEAPAKGGKKQIMLKTPKGMKDFEPDEMRIRNLLQRTMIDVFERHGACSIDTPHMERREVLLGKSGEETTKLIYDLADQGGEILSMRYDLTVPLARYMASRNLRQLKRYQVGRVYRRENTQKGRLREFVQTDFDIVGSYERMMAEAEVLIATCEILQELAITPRFHVEINHRVLLKTVLLDSGVPEPLLSTACSSIDKLDKLPWAAVADEMVAKGIAREATERLRILESFNAAANPQEYLTRMREYLAPKGDASALEALRDLEILFDFLAAAGFPDAVKFNSCLARGHDYYTGVIFETAYLDPATGRPLATVGGGGRYDDLVSVFAPQMGKVPAVGIGIGFERLFSLMMEKEHAKTPVADVLVGFLLGKNETPEQAHRLRAYAVRCSALLWRAGVKCEVWADKKAIFKNQLQRCEEAHIGVLVMLGVTECDTQQVIVKNLASRTQVSVPIDGLVTAVHDMIAPKPASATSTPVTPAAPAPSS